MTVAQWYQLYNRPEYRDMYIVLPRQTQRKGKQNPYAFSVELYINVGQVRHTIWSRCFDRCLTNSQYAARSGDSDIIGFGRAGAKRTVSSCVVRAASSSKRVRGQIPLSTLCLPCF